jgi:hypothetical protein
VPALSATPPLAPDRRQGRGYRGTAGAHHQSEPSAGVTQCHRPSIGRNFGDVRRHPSSMRRRASPPLEALRWNPRTARASNATGAHGAPKRVPLVYQSARGVGPATISDPRSPSETACIGPLSMPNPRFGPHHSHSASDCGVAVSRVPPNLRLCSNFLSSRKPTRGLEPRTPSLRVMSALLPGRMVEPNPNAISAPCATRVPFCNVASARRSRECTVGRCRRRRTRRRRRVVSSAVVLMDRPGQLGSIR